jgi:hypothetical protein
MKKTISAFGALLIATFLMIGSKGNAEPFVIEEVRSVVSTEIGPSDGNYIGLLNSKVVFIEIRQSKRDEDTNDSSFWHFKMSDAEGTILFAFDAKVPISPLTYTDVQGNSLVITPTEKGFYGYQICVGERTYRGYFILDSEKDDMDAHPVAKPNKSYGDDIGS